MATQQNAKSYDASNIKVYKGTEAARKRINMYLGERGDPMVYRAIKELLDNGIDEALEGRNTTVELYSDIDSDYYIAADMGGGIPIETNIETGKSTLDVVFTELHGGGKFDSEAYKRCFTGDTEILLLDGTIRTMEWLANNYSEKSFWVISATLDGKVVAGKAYDPRVTTHTTEMAKVTLDNGKSEYCTVEHRWLMRNGTYKEAQELKSGDSLMAYKVHGPAIASSHKVESVEIIKTKKTPMYDISVEKYHNFCLANGVFVHNSVGINGVGAAVANAVADEMNVYTKRNNVIYHRQYKKGIPQGSIKKLKTLPSSVANHLQRPAKEYGTVIEFKPDQTIVSVDATNNRIKNKAIAKLPVKDTAKWMNMIAMMNPGIIMRISSPKGKKVFINKKDISVFVDKIVEDNDLGVIGHPMVFQSDDLDCSIQWTSDDTTNFFKSYVNCSPTIDKGKHVEGFMSAMTKVLNKFKGARDDFKAADAIVGMVGVLNWKMSQPEFSSQTKDKLTSSVNKELEELIYPALLEYFESNKSMAVQIVKRANAISKGRGELKKIMKSVSDVKKSKRGLLLPNVLTVAEDAKPHERETYVVEGESASGCFVENTPVLQADGTQITFGEMVERTEKGEQLYGVAYDTENKEFKKVPFDTPRLIKYVNELVEVTLSDGSKWVCTLNHPWLIGNEYVSAEDLQEGMALTVFNQSVLTVAAVTKIEKDKPIPVYDATVDTYHNYCLGNGVVVHNTANGARDSSFQEVFKLKGKPTNAAKITISTLLGSKVIQNMLVAFGVDLSSIDLDDDVNNAKFSTENLRIGNVMILTDADTDGSHIAVLLMSAIFRLLPDLFKEGRIYIVKTPLFLCNHNGKRYFGDTLQECRDNMPESAKHVKITRAKGLGELDAEELYDVAFDPKNRKLLCVKPPKDQDALEYFEGIVGKSSEPRKRLLGII